MTTLKYMTQRAYMAFIMKKYKSGPQGTNLQKGQKSSNGGNWHILSKWAILEQGNYAKKRKN